MKTSEIVDYLRATGWEVDEHATFRTPFASKGGLNIHRYSYAYVELRFFVAGRVVWTAKVRTIGGVDAAIKRALQEIRKVELPAVRKQAVQLANVLEAFNVKPL